jgi:hypothetical protein
MLRNKQASAIPIVEASKRLRGASTRVTDGTLSDIDPVWVLQNCLGPIESTERTDRG